MASGQDGGAVSDPGDPAARLLVRIGNFVEPLTRFDRSHISMAGSKHETIGLMARQAFRVSFETQRGDGNGALPPGVSEVADAAALSRENAAQLAAARATAASRLAAWTESHGEDSLARPKIEDCFTPLPALGYVEPCAPCGGAGQITCAVCKGERELICERCKGAGSSTCEVCEASGAVSCQTCKGQGTVVEQKKRKVHDDVIGQDRIEHFQETVSCPICNSAGSVKCRRCDGTGQLTCPVCQGHKKTACARCKGAGSETCQTCGGEGRRHHTATLVCRISETFEVAARTPDVEIARVLKARKDIGEVLKLSSAHHATAETNSDTMRRDTIVETPVTSVVINIGEEQAMIRGFGDEQTVLDYRNLAGMMLAPDLLQLGIANSSTQLAPPRVGEELYGALSNMLASEANITIATTPKPGLAALEQEYRGVVTGDYIKRAHDAVRKGVSRAYWVSLAHGPAAALGLPLFFAPVDLFMRGAGVVARTGLLMFVIALTFGLCLGGHFWVTRQLQKRLAPGGKPAMGPLLEKLGLTRMWLIGSGAAAILLTLVIAMLASALFPSR